MIEQNTWRDHSLRIIIPLVFLFHGCALWILWEIPQSSRTVMPVNRLVTRTIQLKPKTAPVAALAIQPQPMSVKKEEVVTSTPSVNSAQEKIAPLPAPPKSSTKTEIKPKKKVASTTAQVSKKNMVTTAKKLEKPKVAFNDAESHKPSKINLEQEAIKQKQSALLEKAKAEMQKMESKTYLATNLNAVSAPVPIESLHIDSLEITSTSSMNTHELTYRDELARRLKLQIKLPEYGNVHLKLTLNRAGKVVSTQILQASSQANRQHVEKLLPNLVMPAFGNNFVNHAEYTFNVTMSNEL